MSRQIDFGRNGEELAAVWLTKQGFFILQRNWRHGRYEVDIIAGRSGILHFIEVKSRHSTVYGYPEESISRKKLNHILKGASGWLHRWPGHQRVQYDILSIVWRNGALPEYALFEDVY